MRQFKKVLVFFWPVLFLFVIWFAFSYPYFFQQKVPMPSSHLVNSFRPWKYYEEFLGPVKNEAIGDVVMQIYPWKYLTIDELKQGEIAYWNPYSFAGNPHMANFQTAVFSPFNLLYFILPFLDAWSLIVLLQPLLAGLFLYLFMREQKVSKEGSVLSSIAFMFCGFMVVWMAYGTLSMAITFLPLVLIGIERSFYKKRFWSLPVISIGIAISYFSGHVQTSLYLTIFSGLYLCFLYCVTRNIRKFLLVLLFFSLGHLISLIQVIPTLALYQQAIRSSLVYATGEIPLSHFVTIFAPDFFGSPITRNAWLDFYTEWAMFIGVIPFLFAIFSFLKLKPNVLFYAIMGILAYVFASDTPFRQILVVSGIPVLATSIPSRMIVLFSFSFAVLAGFGLDAFVAFLNEKKFKKITIPFIGFELLLFIIWISLMAFHILPTDKALHAVRNLILPTLILTNVFVGIMIFIFFIKHRHISVTSSFMRTSTKICLGILLLLSVFDSLRFATKWAPFDDRKWVFPDHPVIAAMQKYSGNGRVYGTTGSQLSYFGISSLEGYDPLYIKRYGEFILSAKTGVYIPADRAVVEIGYRGKYTKRILDLLGVNLIFFPKIDMKQSWAFPVWEDPLMYTKVYDDGHIHLYTNNTALPRVKLFYSYEVIHDSEKLLNRFYTDSFDFRNVLLLEEDPKLCTDCYQNIMQSGKAEIVSYKPNKVTIAVETESPGLLFLSDNYYPDWKVTVNGKQSKIYRADYTFRAVVVPEGESRVEFVIN